MAKSNGRPMTWAKHNAMLGGHLDEILTALQRLPGIMDRTERYLQKYGERQRSLMSATAPKPSEQGVVTGVRSSV
jgi:hypothetical protein